MRISRSLWVAGLALVLGLGIARAEDQATLMDNPLFEVWSAHNIGSSETLEGKITGPGGQQMVMESTYTLKEKTDDYVTVETSASMEMMGQKHNLPPQQKQIKAQVEKVDVVRVGSEEVSAMGQTFECDVYEIHSDNSKPTEVNAKLWANKDVPGGVVKMEANSPHGTVTLLLKNYVSK
ncbi:MAG: hypothetical protein IT446_12170 [Phycisphaerales bacterium]|jgi:hypothetical protein|nr:hypothetical protein [Phycisphaerales bacterium]